MNNLAEFKAFSMGHFSWVLSILSFFFRNPEEISSNLKYIGMMSWWTGQSCQPEGPDKTVPVDRKLLLISKHGKDNSISCFVRMPQLIRNKAKTTGNHKDDTYLST